MRYKVLSEADVVHFQERGYVRVEEAFSPALALRAQEDLWGPLAERGVQKNVLATWTKPMVSIQETFDTPAFRACKTQRLKDAVEDLVGEGRWRTRDTQDGWGWWPVNFALGADRPWDVPENGWHWDGQHFRHYVSAPDQGLLLLCIFSDIQSHGGATVIAEGSHRIVARFLSHQTEGVELVEGIRACIATHPWLSDLTGRPLAADARWDRERFAAWKQNRDRIERFMDHVFMDDDGSSLRVVEATAAPGDIYLCHPFLFHCQSQNHNGTPRFLCNRTTPLLEPMCFDRPNANYSPLEASIRSTLAETALQSSTTKVGRSEDRTMPMSEAGISTNAR